MVNPACPVLRVLAEIRNGGTHDVLMVVWIPRSLRWSVSLSWLRAWRFTGWGGEPLAGSPHGGLGPAGEPELGQNVRHVGAGGSLGDAPVAAAH